MSLCNDAQEKIARGEPLTVEERAHATACSFCLPAVEAASLFDRLLSAVAPEVPLGFADRVMSQLGEPVEPVVVTRARAAPRPRWFERPWAQLALAHAAALVTLMNVARFLASVLIPAVASGSTTGGSP